MLVTSQVLPILYHASPVWLTPNLMAAERKILESIHYRSLRLKINDYKQRIPHEWVSASTQRLPPCQCGKFAAVSLHHESARDSTPNDDLQ